ncbi:MAG: L-asparaginase [Natronomonas sp.]|jgi:L-asparaginase
MTARIRVLSTGGTIASTRNGREGATPERSGEALVEAVPDLEAHADVSVEEVARAPSFDLDFATLFDLRDAIEEAAAEGVDGVVVTHGTDTMEESAYFVDLTCEADVPVAFTGAQRRPDEVGADGPANLLAAVRAASHDRLIGAGGTYVVFDEEVHAAQDVTKVHTSKLGAFRSPERGPIAALTRDGVRFFREPGTRTGTYSPDPPLPDVRMIKSGVGVSADAVEAALADEVAGIVLEGTGLGNATAAIGDAVGTAIDAGTPVVVTSRCHAGAVGPVYGSPGGGATLAERGAIFAGDLPAHKARIKLALVLATAPSDGVRDAFRDDQSSTSRST